MRLLLLAAVVGACLGAACSEGIWAKDEGSAEKPAAPARTREQAPEAKPGRSGERVEPERLKVRIVAEYPHDRRAYTQGLLWYRGFLYESTGQYGRSTVRRTDLATGAVVEARNLSEQLFGEGLARVGSNLYQLTWQAQIGLMYEAETFEPAGQFYYQGEGWGLCFDGEYLVMSDGGSALSFREPSTFREARRRTVTSAGRPVLRLNELECVSDLVYANVYGTDFLVRIHRESGEVLAWIDASGLLTGAERRGAEVLNGIAYVPERETFLLTGKYWPKTFEVTLDGE